MSANFTAILWNKQKKWYDITFGAIIVSYLICYFSLNTVLYPTITFETMLIRSFGTLAFLMLHVILSIGPLARLDNRFLVLLYNRRHLGVTMFIVASVHALFSLFQFHSNGNIHPLLSLFLSNKHYDSFIYFPFQTLGFGAYLILMLMAFTSHDFWLGVLSPKIWKSLHIMVYIAYFLLVLHVLLGVIELENSPIYFSILLLGVLWLVGLHVFAGLKEWRFDNMKNVVEDGWVKVCPIDEISDSKAKMVSANGERIAIFKYDNKLSAVHNVCKHQNGPLGEGKIIDGCITCPWHGYQYEPANGCAPAPFTEKVATYKTKIINDEVWVNSNALPEGTYVEPTLVESGELRVKSGEKQEYHSPHSTLNSPLSTKFYIGWQPVADNVFRFFARKTSILILFISLLTAVFISFNQKHIDNSEFIFDETKLYKGQLIAKPFPALRTLVGKDVFGNPLIKTYPLINVWKFGADSLVQKILGGSDAADVTLKGDLLKRDKANALVLNYGDTSVHILNKFSTADKFSGGIEKDTIINGEIIDPKCYLGAMNPGEGKPHRSCAIRCIEGGVMPMVAYKDKNGVQKYAVLLGENGQTLNTVIGFAVAEPVRLQGKLMTIDNWEVLKIKFPDGLVRLNITLSSVSYK